MTHQPRSLHSSAFSLIEIMMVISMIGVLAALASFNVQKFVGRSRQGEARANLNSAWAASLAYYSEHGDVDPSKIGFKTKPAIPYYYYHLEGVDENNNGGNADILGSSVKVEELMTQLEAQFPGEFGDDGGQRRLFVAAAGNIDSDPELDCWIYTFDGGLQNAYDDVTNTTHAIVGLNTGPILGLTFPPGPT